MVTDSDIFYCRIYDRKVPFTLLAPICSSPANLKFKEYYPDIASKHVPEGHHLSPQGVSKQLRESPTDHPGSNSPYSLPLCDGQGEDGNSDPFN